MDPKAVLDRRFGESLTFNLAILLVLIFLMIFAIPKFFEHRSQLARSKVTTEASGGQDCGASGCQGPNLAVSWSPIHYIVDIRCTYGMGCTGGWNQWTSCSSWPTGTCPPYNITGNSVSVLVANGYRFEYRVWIITKRDGDPSNIAIYPWVNPTSINTQCGTITCTRTLSWARAVYNAQLTLHGTISNPCSIVSNSCRSSANVTASQAIFSGLPANTNLDLYVNVKDVNGTSHFLLAQNAGTTGSCTNCPTPTPTPTPPPQITLSVDTTTPVNHDTGWPGNLALFSWPAIPGYPTGAAYSLGIWPATSTNCDQNPPITSGQVTDGVVPKTFTYMGSGSSWLWSANYGNYKARLYTYGAAISNCVSFHVDQMQVVLSANVLSDHVSFTWLGGGPYLTIYAWPASSPNACSNVNSDVVWSEGPTDSGGANWISPPPGTYKARLAWNQPDPWRSDCASFVVSSITCQKADVNGDGVVNILDTQLVAKHSSLVSPTPAYEAKYDVNGDGVVNILDVNLVQRCSTS